MKKDELFLKGRLQVETAHLALTFTGLNDIAKDRLGTMLAIHDRVTDFEDQDDLILYTEGGVVEQDKADILTSLDALAYSDITSPELQIAAQALRQIL